MCRSVTGTLVVALVLCFSEMAFAQSEELTPESQHHQNSQPTQDGAAPPPASISPEQRDEAYSAAIQKCSEQTGPQQEQCITEATQRYGRM